jgi:Effector-associated domain 2
VDDTDDDPSPARGRPDHLRQRDRSGRQDHLPQENHLPQRDHLPQPDHLWQRTVVQALCASPVLADRNARAMLVELVSHGVGRPVTVREQPTVRLQFLELVRFCLRTEGGPRALLEAVESVEGPGLTLDTIGEQVRGIGAGRAPADPPPPHRAGER